ncbi:MAG: recombinase RmuC [Gammaproteobacteria bacterium GWE2_37_16]|nr:MAG: recombinase RmuC [Gammaproteobacteria bacterium GWE2_37_16]
MPSIVIILSSLLILIAVGFLFIQLMKLNTRLEERERVNNEFKENLAKTLQTQREELRDYLARQLKEQRDEQVGLRENLTRLLKEQRDEQIELRSKFDKNQLENLKHIIDSLQKGTSEIRNQITEVLKQNTQILDARLHKLTDDTNARLNEINNRVEKRLAESFEKTTATFTDVVKRLALIDEAQKNITKLSGDVVSLKEILADKRSRGAFGEVQLESLIRNVLSEKTFAFQYTLSNSKRADCVLFLPEPTGNIIIDAKFPLENFQRLADFNLPESERLQAQKQFRNDIYKHIHDIAEKYIIEGETSTGAIMFIPAEAIFAEIHAHHPDIVETSHRANVWMVSPTTMMAVLTTVKAVLKDAATRQQAHLIREHLLRLKDEFERFQERMTKLAQHVKQAHDDIQDVHTTSKKITNQFSKIEKVELGERPEGSEGIELMN